jgi:signal recognition particle receptor subunit beta
VKLVNCDLSGHKSFRSIWDSLIVGKPDVLVYVVDASDSSTISETRDILKSFVSSERLKNTPLIILYNKTDVDGVPSAEKLNSELGLPGLLSGREWKAIQTSAKNGAGISDLLEWILQQIKAKTGVGVQ